MLPKHLSNIKELIVRKKDSENAGNFNEREARSLYDKHNFRQLAYIRVSDKLQRLPGNPRVLDVGIGWGMFYTPFISRITLWGIDFSFETLLFLKNMYLKANLPIPVLICASVAAIPIKDIKFDLIWSSQVYQHIPDKKEIKESFRHIISDLLEHKGFFCVDCRNYNRVIIKETLQQFISILKRGKKPIRLGQENITAELYTKYYTENDFMECIKGSSESIKYKISYTENFFHPEIGIYSNSALAAKLDRLISFFPLVTKYLGRHIVLTVEKS